MRNDEKLHLHKQKLLEREKDEVKFGKRMIWLVRRERWKKSLYSDNGEEGVFVWCEGKSKPSSTHFPTEFTLRFSRQWS